MVFQTLAIFFPAGGTTIWCTSSRHSGTSLHIISGFIEGMCRSYLPYI